MAMHHVNTLVDEMSLERGGRLYSFNALNPSYIILKKNIYYYIFQYLLYIYYTLFRDDKQL